MVAIETKLREWAEQYFRNKDLLTRTITNIAQQSEGWDLVITTKQGEKYVLVLPELDKLPASLEKIADEQVYVITTNSRDNVDALAKEWTGIAKQKKLFILFVNPDSMTEKKWVIMPHVHDKITEKKILKSGLFSLFSTVDEFGE